MLFNSWIYFLFLPLVFTVFFLIPHRVRTFFLLAVSYLFYGWWKPEFLFIIAFSTVLDYFCGLKIGKSGTGTSRKLWLILSIVINLSILFFFKYFYFFIGSTDYLQALVHPYPPLHNLVDFLSQSLPVGISFYTFQSMSYTIDVYYGRAKPEKNLPGFALYVAYFPQLVAGPIERFSHLSSQLKEKRFIRYENLQKGFRLMLYGFFVKMVIADNLSYTVSSVFNEPGKWVCYWNLIGIFSFGFQIYADFFGYSLIAQGTARLFGVDLMDNFRRPYFSKGISDFWGRWHISLSTWFRDYLYIPLGGNRVGKWRWIFNILLVFSLSGLWHGANYTFIIWGVLHGFYYLFERFSPVKIVNRAFRGIITFLAVSFAWIFFRAENLEDAFRVIRASAGIEDGSRQLDTQPYIFLLLLIFILFEWLRGENRFDAFCERFNGIQRWTLYCFILFCILVLSASEYSPFIYFRF